MILLPRLGRAEVGTVVAGLNALSRPGPEMARELVEQLSLRPHWNSSGGTPAGDAERVRFAETLRSLASEHGYPEYPDLAQQQAFDRNLCRVLDEETLLDPDSGETLRAACWAGLTILDILDLAVWRHATPGKSGSFISGDRLQGGNRNFLRRAWLRNQALLPAGVMGEERWLLVDGLNEDAFVQIVERPSIASEKRLAQAIGQAWLDRSPQRIPIEAIMRSATRSIRAYAETRMISVLPDQELQELVNDAFDRAQALEERAGKAAQKRALSNLRGGPLKRITDALRRENP